MDMDRLNEQFLDYQLLSADDIPPVAKETAGLNEDDPHQVDILCGYLKGMKKPGASRCEFDLLFKVAEVMNIIPHSNAGEERIFSLINKNKTPSRSSMKFDSTLSSIIVVKTHIDDLLLWQPTKSLVEKAKKATKLYNSNSLLNYVLCLYMQGRLYVCICGPPAKLMTFMTNKYEY